MASLPTTMLSNLLLPPTGKMRLVSSQGRQPLSPLMEPVLPGAPNKMIEIGPGETVVLADIPGAGQIVRIWMTTMSLPRDPYSFHHYGVLRFYWDGEAEPSVDVPFGAFFGVPWGSYTHYHAAPLSCTSGGYNCQFPMPFERGCRIEVVNQSPVKRGEFFFQIQYLALDQPPSPLRFHAQWRRENPTRPGVPYKIIEAQGSGNFAGMHLFMQNASRWLQPRKMLEKYRQTKNALTAFFPEMLGMGMLEGWERIAVDGEPVPAVSGTGTEDYFNSGFYFSKGPFSAPEWGCTVRDYLSARCAAYRFHISDPIPFQRSLVVEMDHGYTNTVAGDYSSVAYWYQDEPHAPFPPLSGPAARLPSPVDQNRAQMALFASPVWIPAAWIGWKLLRKAARWLAS